MKVLLFILIYAAALAFIIRFVAVSTRGDRK